MSDPFASPIDPFDLLHEEAIRLMATKPKVKNATINDPTKMPLRYADLSTWQSGRCVALIHEDQGNLTLLGNFREYTHPQLRGARRLVRVEGPVAAESQERVKGEWWLTPSVAEPEAGKRWAKTKEAILGITLDECGLHCPDTHVLVDIYLAGILKVRLASETRFGCPARNTFMILPQGLNILPAMDLDSKLNLHKELEDDAE